MEKQPDEPEDFTNEPLIVVSKSKAQKQREYRQRIAASRTPAEAAAARRSKTERQRNNRLRKAAIARGSLEAIASSHSGEESNNDQTSSQRQSTTTADQPDERVNLTNEPLFSAIRAAPKTRAQIQREYRQRIAASKTPAQAAAAREARNLRDRNNRLRQAPNLAVARGSEEATTPSSSRLGQRLNTVHIDTQRQYTDQQRQTLATEAAETTVQPSTSSDQIEVQEQSTCDTKCASSNMRLKSTFLDNDFGYPKPIIAAELKVHFAEEMWNGYEKMELKPDAVPFMPCMGPDGTWEETKPSTLYLPVSTDGTSTQGFTIKEEPSCEEIIIKEEPVDINDEPLYDTEPPPLIPLYSNQPPPLVPFSLNQQPPALVSLNQTRLPPLIPLTGSRIDEEDGRSEDDAEWSAMNPGVVLVRENGVSRSVQKLLKANSVLGQKLKAAENRIERLEREIVLLKNKYGQ